MLAVLPLLETFLRRVFRNTTQVLRRIFFDGVNVVESLSFSCHFKFGKQPEVTGSHVGGAE
jgi:predicted nuclease with RNAse H fold